MANQQSSLKNQTIEDIKLYFEKNIDIHIYNIYIYIYSGINETKQR